MSRYIDADDAIEKYAHYGISHMWDATDLEEILNEMQSIEIIRCRECKHWCKGDEVYGICYRCPNTRQMRYDDFCSYGERREP